MTQPGNGNIGQLNNNETRAEHAAASTAGPLRAKPAMPMPPARPRWAPERDPLGCALFLLSEPAGVFHTSHRFHGSDGVARLPRLAHTAFYNA